MRMENQIESHNHNVIDDIVVNSTRSEGRPHSGADPIICEECRECDLLVLRSFVYRLSYSSQKSKDVHLSDICYTTTMGPSGMSSSLPSIAELKIALISTIFCISPKYTGQKHISCQKNHPCVFSRRPGPVHVPVSIGLCFVMKCLIGSLEYKN